MFQQVISFLEEVYDGWINRSNLTFYF